VRPAGALLQDNPQQPAENALLGRLRFIVLKCSRDSDFYFRLTTQFAENALSVISGGRLRFIEIQRKLYH